MCWEPEAWLTPLPKHGSDALALPSLLLAPPCDHSCPLSSQDVAEGWGQARVRQMQNTAEAGLTCGWQVMGCHVNSYAASASQQGNSSAIILDPGTEPDQALTYRDL